MRASRDDSVTAHDQRRAVFRHHATDGTRGTGAASRRGYPAVTPGLSKGDPPHRLDDRSGKWRKVTSLDCHVEKVVETAGGVSGKSIDKIADGIVLTHAAVVI